MASRADIELILDQAYTARRKQDLDAVLDCFGAESRFKVNGAEADAADRGQQRSAIQGIFDAFQLMEFHSHSRVIDPPKAVVHWRGKFRANKTGQVVDTDVLDLIEIRDGRIAS